MRQNVNLKVHPKYISYVLLLIGCFAYLNSTGYANDTSLKTLSNTQCPVTTDEKAEPDIWLDYEDKRIYFCCKSCRKDFIDDPQIYLANIPKVSSSEVVPTGITVGTNHSEHQHDHDSNKEISVGLTDTTHGPIHDHDHTTDHGHVSGFNRLIKFFGKFHPLVIHFPIALILVALLAEFLTVILGEESIYESTGRFCIVLGAIGAVFSAALGWMAGEFANYPGELTVILFRHRWLGVGTAILTVITAILGSRKSRTGQPNAKKLYRGFLILNAIAVSLTGHLGATLIYGLDYFSW